MITISPYTQIANKQTNKQNNINFTSFWHETINEAGTVVKGNTCLYRFDLTWDSLVHYIARKYANAPKVNVIDHGCSIGEEAYTFVTVLIDRYGKYADKFLPIKAKDINKEYLDIANQGTYNYGELEAALMQIYLNDRYKKYYNQIGDKKGKLIVKDSIKNMVHFEQGDIIQDAKNIDFHNTVLFARNLWPYLSFNDRHKLAEILYERMDNTSTLIIGGFDKYKDIDRLLELHGFAEVENVVEHVFEKKAD